MGEIRKSRQNIQKVLCFQQNVWKVSNFDSKHRNLFNFYAKYSKSFVCEPKAFEKYVFLTQNIQKVFYYVPQNSRSIKKSYPSIWKLCTFGPKHWTNISTQRTVKIWYSHTKVFEKFCTPYETFKKYFVWTQNSRQVFDLSSKHLKSIWCRSKVFDSIDFQRKNFGKYRICTQNIWEILDFCAKHSKSIRSLLKLFKM